MPCSCLTGIAGLCNYSEPSLSNRLNNSTPVRHALYRLGGTRKDAVMYGRFPICAVSGRLTYSDHDDEEPRPRKCLCGFLMIVRTDGHNPGGQEVEERFCDLRRTTTQDQFTT